MPEFPLDALLALIVVAAAAVMVAAAAVLGFAETPSFRSRAVRAGMTALLVAVAALAGQAVPGMLATVEAQESTPDGAYDEKSGLITPGTPGGDVRIVTTDTVPGQSCVALDSDGAQLPVMVLPGFGKPGIRAQLAAIRGMQTLREAAAEAGANAVLGLRTAAFVNRQGNPRLFLYGTLARCE